MFTGAEGVEGILVQVKERFDAISGTLDFNTGEELFNNFEEVLQDLGASRWQLSCTLRVTVVTEIVFFSLLFTVTAVTTVTLRSVTA